MDAIRFLQALHSSSTIKTSEGNLTVASTTYITTGTPVVMRVGPFTCVLSLEEARALGAALIETAHHWQAELAKWQQTQEAKA